MILLTCNVHTNETLPALFIHDSLSLIKVDSLYSWFCKCPIRVAEAVAIYAVAAGAKVADLAHDAAPEAKLFHPVVDTGVIRRGYRLRMG